MKRFLMFFVLVPLILCGTPPKAIWLTWQQDPSTTMTIQWLSDDLEDKVSFRTTGDGNWNNIQASHATLPDYYNGIIHRIELTQLKPNSSYEFKLGEEETSWQFRTMPDNLNNPIHFIVGGDMYHDSLKDLRRTNQEAADHNPAFVVIGGDIAYSSNHFSFIKEDGSRWLSWLQAWYEDLVTKEGYLIPIIPVIGNHEVNGRYGQTPEQAKFFYALFPMPENHAYRSLDFGSYLSLILLDSGHTADVGGAQKTWLRQTLATKKDFPNKFAVYHVPAYPSVRNENDAHCKEVRDNWTPIFDEFNLDVAFEHHDHAYKRTYKLRNHKKDDTGTLYIGDGAWGVDKSRERRQPAWYLKKAIPKRHFIVVHIHKDKRRFFAVSDSGKIIDSYTD